MDKKEIVKYQAANGTDITLSVDLARKALCSNAKNATDEEIIQFIELCRYQRINPFLREAYLVKYGDVNAECSIITSKELFLKRAEQNDMYDGAESGIIVLRDGKVEYINGTFSLPSDQVVGGWSKIYRKDQSHPTEISVSLTEYVQKKKNGEITKFWRDKPATMIRKVALMQGLREAFCTSLGCLYTEEEQSVTIDTTAEVVETKPQQPTETKPAKVEPQLSQLELAKQKVMRYIGEGCIAEAENGLLWIKSAYPNENLSSLEKVVEGAKANITEESFNEV